MEYRLLGRSGLIVSTLSLGTMIFGEESDRGTSSDVAVQMIDRYLEAGGNFIDTANVYAGGRSEEIIGQALQGKRQSVVLASKVRFSRQSGVNEGGLSRKYIMQSMEESLRRLQTDYLDLYYMHAWDALTPIEESVRAFDDLVQAGKVRYIGFSNFKAWQIVKGLWVSDANHWSRFVVGQYQYSLVSREIEEEFNDLYPSEGLGLTAWGPLGGGFLSGKYRADKVPQTADEGRIATTNPIYEEAWERRATEQNWRIIANVRQIAQAHYASVAQVALAWLRQQPLLTSVILGARTPEQLEDNLASASLTLSTDELTALDQASVLPGRYPYRMIEMSKRTL